MIPIQAIRNAMVNDLAVRSVADLADVPAGQLGIEEARALRWPEADLVPCAVAGARTELIAGTAGT